MREVNFGKTYGGIKLRARHPCAADFPGGDRPPAGYMNVSLYLGFKTFNGNLMAILSVILIIMVLAILGDSVRVWLRLYKTAKPVGMNTDVPAVCKFGETKPNIPS